MANRSSLFASGSSATLRHGVTNSARWISRQTVGRAWRAGNNIIEIGVAASLGAIAGVIKGFVSPKDASFAAPLTAPFQEAHEYATRTRQGQHW